jgi:hypothetical protein
MTDSTVCTKREKESEVGGGKTVRESENDRIIRSKRGGGWGNRSQNTLRERERERERL